MYIPEFWVGVITTLVLGFVALIAWGACLGDKDKKE